MWPVSGVRVYVALGATDLRKSLDSLAALVAGQLGMDPLSGSLFVFANRRRKLVKVLYWDRNGYCLWQKRLERQIFRWLPGEPGTVAGLGWRELSWLLEGLDPRDLQGHETLSYTVTT